MSVEVPYFSQLLKEGAVVVDGRMYRPRMVMDRDLDLERDDMLKLGDHVLALEPLEQLEDLERAYFHEPANYEAFSKLQDDFLKKNEDKAPRKIHEVVVEADLLQFIVDEVMPYFIASEEAIGDLLAPVLGEEYRAKEREAKEPTPAPRTGLDAMVINALKKSKEGPTVDQKLSAPAPQDTPPEEDGTSGRKQKGFASLERSSLVKETLAHMHLADFATLNLTGGSDEPIFDLIPAEDIAAESHAVRVGGQVYRLETRSLTEDLLTSYNAADGRLFTLEELDTKDLVTKQILRQGNAKSMVQIGDRHFKISPRKDIAQLIAKTGGAQDGLFSVRLADPDTDDSGITLSFKDSSYQLRIRSQLGDLFDSYNTRIAKMVQWEALSNQEGVQRAKDLQEQLEGILREPRYREAGLGIERVNHNVYLLSLDVPEFANRGEDGHIYLFPECTVSVPVLAVKKSPSEPTQFSMARSPYVEGSFLHPFVTFEKEMVKGDLQEDQSICLDDENVPLDERASSIFKGFPLGKQIAAYLMRGAEVLQTGYLLDDTPGMLRVKPRTSFDYRGEKDGKTYILDYNVLRVSEAEAKKRGLEMRNVGV